MQPTHFPVIPHTPPAPAPAAPDVALADEHARVVDALGQAKLEHQGLQAALQHVSGRQRKHVIELVLHEWKGLREAGGFEGQRQAPRTVLVPAPSSIR